MIYPSRLAILVTAGIAPPALLVGVIAPAYWHMGLVALMLVLTLTAADALLGPTFKDVELTCDVPGTVSVGAQFEIGMHVRFLRGAPKETEVAISFDRLLSASEGYRTKMTLAGGVGFSILEFSALRRGTAIVSMGWLRWRGLLGLAWKLKRIPLDIRILITPDIRPVREKSAQLLHRDAMHGLVARQQVGEGSEFEALAEYRPVMDRRSIDWKQSARHMVLLAKEYRTERNNNVIMAIDAGRLMCEPLAGLPRVDRAISAALLTAFVALKDGDKVGFFAFDSHPRVSSNAVSGHRSFALLQRVAAEIDYSSNETNYTLALATLASGINRRSLIIVFTDFADTISAELMLNAVATLLRRHLVLFIVMRDQELEDMVAAEPAEAADVPRAVTAGALLRDRRLVIARLRRLGVEVIEAAHDQAGPALVNAYLDIKRKNRL